MPFACFSSSNLHYFCRRKGISSSALPYKRTPPSWLKISASDVSHLTLVAPFYWDRLLKPVDARDLFLRWRTTSASLRERGWVRRRLVSFFVILTASPRSRASPGARYSGSSRLMVFINFHSNGVFVFFLFGGLICTFNMLYTHIWCCHELFVIYVLMWWRSSTGYSGGSVLPD